ncbi:hypothetical protein K458DRAFT_317443 [Lentithecium fluviatile CBS 122367]|uniref:GRAM domain-containing protein n=1 Tax=Lentithecium fluviatile CBS 122367 TaxID=1168545 RepID=A0A6G1IJV8_9PLEO|nr:hypothetical protein K458DRAFT_317443 [Lentithecium fluviatile CBS 122367]
MRKNKSNRKNSWVMLAESGGYTPLPGEQTLYQSPPRTTLSIQTPNRQPPSEAYSKQCKSGVVYLTNRRVIYLPVSPTADLQSFAVPILNVTDTRVTAPWFGANKWEAVIQPVYGGGIPAQHAELELVMEFKEGGAFDFASTFERLKERLKQAVDVAGMSGSEGAETGDGRGGGALAGVNLASVHLDELPAYEDSGRYTRVPENLPSPPLGRGSVGGESTASTANRSTPLSSPHQETFQPPPTEPPPGYEEVQQSSVADELERRLRLSPSEQ